MSLVVLIKGPEGVVLAADTRLTFSQTRPDGSPITVHFDNATKVLTFGRNHHHVGAVTFGLASIAGRTAHSLIPEFEVEIGDTRLAINEYALRLSGFFLKRWLEAGMPEQHPSSGMTFVVGGYDEGMAYGDVYEFTIPHSPTPMRRFANEFRILWGGQTSTAAVLINGFDARLLPLIEDRLALPKDTLDALVDILKSSGQPIPTESLALQDCIDLAIFLVRTTISFQGFAVMDRGVGGIIEVAYITRTEGLQWAQRKEIHGER